jgi:SAM-dependent methyltransferase
VDAWGRSLRAYAARLEPKRKATFLAAFDAPLYHMQGQAALEAEGGLHPKHRVMRYHDFFVERVSPGERAIDLGCGVGALAASVAERSRAHVTGMDWTESNLERARKAAASRGLADRLTYTLGDITKDRPPLPSPARFDAVILSNVLEHITDRPERLRLWREWYRPSRFLIRVPAFDREWRVPWKRELGVEWRLDITHETEYTQSQLEAELQQAGLRVRDLIARWGEYWVEAGDA